MSPAVAEQFDPTVTIAPLGELVPLSKLQPSPLNPRKRFDAGTLADLQANIEKHGVIVPLLVRRHFDAGSWVGEVIDGERRYRASRSSSLTQVPCVFRDELTDGEVIEIQLLSAIQRQDLTPLEEAAGFKALIDSNPSLYSAAYIADRVGRSERWVWDRMQLLNLIPELQQHLEADRILVGHAELLAKLKPEDQARLNEDIGGGLWESTHAELYLEDEDDDAAEAHPHRHVKPRTVKELEAWIARHIRFDAQHMAVTAPLDFGPVADRIVEALAKPGRGKKVVPITFDFTVHPDAKGDDRTYGQTAWKRADGRDQDAPVCDHAVLGTVVAGRHYGQAFDVCIARDKCDVHWKDEIKAREKNQKLQQQGKGGQAAQNAEQRRINEETRAKEQQAQREAWGKLEVLLDTEAIAQVKKVKALTPAHARFIDLCEFYNVGEDCETHLGSKWFLQPAAAWLIAAVNGRRHTTSFDDYINRVVKPLGLKVPPFNAILAALQPKPAAAAKKSVAKAATKKTVKSTARTKKR